MTRYKLTRQHFIPDTENPEGGPRLMEAGAEVEWGDNPPTLGMEGVDEAGRKRVNERAAEERGKREAAAAKAPGKSTTVMDNVVPRNQEEEEPQTRRRGR